MATATAVLANETEIKQAMGVLGLDGLADALLDEIELDRELAISIAQADRGETITIDELEKRVNEKVANGYYKR
jgi:hypothetical protein